MNKRIELAGLMVACGAFLMIQGCAKTAVHGGDPQAVQWRQVDERWVQNIYPDGSMTMSDGKTGLMWVYTASRGGAMTWDEAKAYCDNLTHAGYTDWQMPAVERLYELWLDKDLFFVARNYHYWSGTLYSNPERPGMAWGVLLDENKGNMNFLPREHKSFVVPVRSARR